jgi:perosamine synthetase
MIYLYNPEVTKEDIRSVNKALSKKWLSGNSPIIKEFEEKLAHFLDVKYVSTCSSGTAGLHLALLGLDIKDGDEVIMPSLSYIATANSVTYVGAKPVFVDVDERTWQLDTSKIEREITKKTKAIMPVHLYGGVPNLNEISKIANKYNLKIVHDSAEGLGSKFKNTHATNFKDISVVSFFPNKIMTTGEGGAVITNNKKVYKLIEKLKSQGLKNKTEYLHSHIGYNYRMNALSASLGASQINRINKNIQLKKKLYTDYKRELEPLGFTFQEFEDKSTSSYWLISALIPKNISKKNFKKFLYENKIETRNIFYPLHKQPPYINNDQNGFLESSEKISKFGLSLPSSPTLTEPEFKKIIKTIKNYVI